MKTVTREQAEKILHDRFYNKMVSFKYPGYPAIQGKVDDIAFDGVEIIVQINDKRYTCSVECLNECLTLLTTK